MDTLMERQHTLFGRISRAVENLKKLGKTNMTKGTIQTKLATLESTWAEFQSQDLQLDTNATAEDRKAAYFTEELFEETEDMFCIQKGQLLTLLDDLEREMGPPAAPSADNAPLPSSGRRSRSSMPRIDLPTFSGRFAQWTRFRDLFTALVIKDDDWTDAERFHYLSASLSGEAAELINRIPITGSNFVKAWELLQHRYQNRRLLIAAQFDLLFNATPCIAHTAGELTAILNNTCNVASNLNSLDVPVDDASHWVVHQTVQKLDKETVKEWEKSLGNRVEPPPLSELFEFLETTIRGLEAYEVRQNAHGPASQPTTSPKVRTLHTATSTSSRVRCNLCQGSHILCFCSAFKSMTPAARLHLVSTRRWCTNCLGPHDVTACPSPKRCQRCAEMHHSMLHDAIIVPSSPTPAASLHTMEGGYQPTGPTSVLLATALVVVTAGGRTTTARALVDPCSEVSLVIESLAQRMRLPRTSCSRLVFGAGANATATTRGKVVMTLSSTTANNVQSCKVEALVLPRITTYRPCCSKPTHDWPHMEDLQLADPRTMVTTPIEVLLGADVYPQILREGTRRGGRHAPIAQETIFGWILSGPTARRRASPQTVSAHTCTTDDLTALVHRFWEQEELQPIAPHWTEEEAACEHTYKQTHSRQSDGSERTKRRTEEIRSKFPVEELSYATQMSFRTAGNLDASKLLQDVSQNSSKATEYIKSVESKKERTLSGDVALAYIIRKHLLSKDGSIVWKNPRPSSPRYCRPIRIQFLHETVNATVSEMAYVENQIKELKPLKIVVEGKEVFVRYDLHLTMIDATSKEFNNIDMLLDKNINEDHVRFGLSTLHAWIRFFECCLHLSYKVTIKKWQVRSSSKEKQEMEQRKQLIQRGLRRELGLIGRLEVLATFSGFGTTVRRLQANPTLYDAYHAFMKEYQQLGHMLAVPRTAECTSRPHFYLPHHGVLKGTGAAAKLRVVFNGSRLSSSGQSLNQYLAAGPKLQRELMDVLLRWRRHKVAFITDIEKMYRQIQIHPDDRDYQRILWRDDASARIQVFHLATVTYGLSCAPFLAIRTLLQLADDEEKRHPRGASILREATYVDDILSGADTVEEARRTQAELIDICKAGGFTLKKWNSNHSGLLSHLPADFLASSSAIPWYPELGCSALGLTWHPQEDTLSFSFYGHHASPTPATITKRYILSQIAKLFDPLGWLAPFLVRGKILLQNLWQLKLGWDDRLPDTAAETWTTMTTDAATLSTLRIPRWLGVDSTSSSLQLHVFVDASEKAYAAAAYLRASSLHGSQVILVAAKTKTAPLKNVSLPRLELCATVLGARLLQRVKREIQMTIDTTHLWSDSTIALAWLHGEPMHWRTFVANRVSEVQRTMPDVHLHHVRTADNPADCASRGIPASQLANHPLWWTEPRWLRDAPTTWDTSTPTLTTTEEERPPATCLHAVHPEAGYEELLRRYSQLHKLIRVTAWCLRWRRPRTTPAPTLHPEEINRAECCWIKLVQNHEFRNDLTALRRGKPPGSTSPLRTMAPFIDDHGVLRVGGRIRNSLLSYDEQNPIILPPGSGFTHLIIDQHHHRTLHGGVQLTLASTRQRFWIPQGRQQVKGRISRCLTCLRWRAASVKQVMGDLPLHRVTPSRPFLHTGLDYAGPFRLKTTPGRGHKSIKGYVSIFVCFSSKAVHIEAVSDYSTPAFLAAFRRFTGRRGLCASLTSDCGTNFVGADRELRRMFKASSKQSTVIANQLSHDGVQWRFNPPGAPHFGGLWEAAVRSVKHHLRRVIGENPLTYEEFSTFLCQVEACLNSRPLQPLTDDPEDLTPLTPGHFLIGGPLLAVPEPSKHDIPSSRLTRWQQQQQRLEHFWRRWSAEYLHQLQSRPRWTNPQPSLTVGDLVLVKAETTPPTQWPLARVIDVHPGPDGQNT
ncbi:uncharacterized protein LOC143211104 [Lasioglossum baleicum]|uniref:uncharacterized protein LOC143211104 n=1 Tax=Lasioglossum baleicum TaxID=434251 RepID=UPI003FCCEDEA